MAESIRSFTWIVMITGMLMLAGGVLLFFRQRARVARSLHAEGIIVELLRQPAQGERIRVKTGDGTKLKKKYLYRPVIEFKSTNGRGIKFTAGIASRPTPYQVGDTVDVLYNPDAPHQAQINHFIHLWFYPLLFVFFGVFLVVVGLVGFVNSAP